MPAVLEWRAEVPPVEWEYGVRFAPEGVAPWVQPFDAADGALLYAEHHNHRVAADEATAVRRPRVDIPEWEPIPEEVSGDA